MAGHDTDDIAALARDLKARLFWECELGGEGYTLPEPAEPSTPESRPAAPASADPLSVASRQTPDAAASLDDLRGHIGECTRCELSRGRTRLVFGEGNPQADIVFVGEGPGRDEDKAGRPFVGAAGQLLDRIIQAMTLSRESVYICNIVKCRPPNNRAPEPEERAVCGEFVWRQLDIIRPKVVVALGATAQQYLLSTNASVGSLRGRFHDVDGFKIMATYHPAYLLRNPGGKRAVWEDMKMVMSYLGLTPGGRGTG